jgi:hypothetical protein
MNQLAPYLIAASAAVILFLGLVHLLYTFRGSKLHPRDPELTARLKESFPVLTRRTTMWKAWVGFNASHSFGAILFGSIYGYLSLVHSAFLFRSAFLLLLGLLALAAYLFLAKRYWFSAPFNGILLATALYTLGLVIAFFG